MAVVQNPEFDTVRLNSEEVSVQRYIISQFLAEEIFNEINRS